MRGKEMLESLLRCIKRLLVSRLGQSLFAVNLAFIVYAFIERGALEIRNCLVYESALLQILMLLNLPAFILSAIITQPLFGDDSLAFAGSWRSIVGGAIVFFSVYLQWCFVGFCIERWLVVRKELQRPPAA
jgi:hypothetical protein